MAAIAIDARELTGRPTGVGRYLRELLRRWSAAPSRHDFALFTHVPLAPDVPLARQAIVLAGDGGVRWEQAVFARAIRRNRPDVLFAPAASAPLLVTTPIVMTIHDLSYMAHPEWFRWPEGLRRRLTTRLTARRARVVLTDSAFSAAEIVERLGVPASMVRVIYLGAPNEPGSRDMPDFWSNPSDTAHREPLVLFVGSLFNRRRIPDVIRAFRRVLSQAPAARLMIVGDNRTYPREDPEALASSLGIADHVDVRTYRTDQDVAALYRRASVFVFVSEYEGFGLTPLEALAHGVPIVVAETPVSREIYGDAALTVPIGDVPALAEAIATLLLHPVRRQALAARAPDTLARYSWDRTAAETLMAIEQAARR